MKTLRMIQGRKKKSLLNIVLRKGTLTENPKKTLCLIALSLFCFLYSSIIFSSTQSLEQKLKVADQIKSSDPVYFNEILADLSGYKEQLKKEQLLQLQYLDSYSKAYRGEYDPAIKGYLEVINESEDKSLRFRARTSLVNIFYIVRQYQESIEHLQILVTELPEISEPDIRQLGLMAVIMSYKGYKKYELALKYSHKLIEENPTGRNLCFARQLKYESLTYVKPESINIDELEEALNHCLSIGERIASALLRLSIARLQLEEQPVMVMNYLAEHYEDVKKTAYQRVIAEYLIVYARANWLAQQEDNAVKLAEEVIHISVDSDFIQAKVLAYALLYEIEKAAGNFKMALEYYEKYSKADKAQINEILAQEMAYQIVEHQTAEKEQEIKFLNEQNKVLQLQQDLAKKEAVNNRLVLALALVLLGTLAFWTYRIKRNQIRLRKQSQTDQLTGLSSRHHFYETAKAILQRSEQEKQDVGFILFDMDYFKSINDKYGHLVGDWVLQQTAEVVKTSCRQNDLAGRLGGEEFAIFLPACNLKKAQQLAEICRKAISQVDTTETGYRFDISASFGVTSTELSGYDLMDLIADADKAMYSAKSKGRNQIVVVDSFVKEFEQLMS